VAALLSLLFALVSSPAAADDFEDFERARAAYDAGNYPEAVERFTELVGTDPPRLGPGPIRLESRKFFAAALLFIGQRQAAYTQFVALLEEDPAYLIDATSFPHEIVELFEEVRTSIQAERERREQEVRERERAEREFQEAERIRLQAARERVLELAREETTVTLNSRWLAMLPFGVGQFQNRNNGLGITLAVVQGLSLGTAIVLYLSHVGLRDEMPNESTIDDARIIESRLRVGNWIANGVFLASYVVGVVDAQLRFVPERRTMRSRELPSDLEESIQLSIGPLGARLQIRF